MAGQPVSSETDIAIARGQGGRRIEAVAREHGLDFVPLQGERLDLVIRRVELFEAPLQRLFTFHAHGTFRHRAALFGGYDITNTGAVVFNAGR